MALQEHTRPAKKNTFREPLEGELRNVFQHLSKVDLGPFRFIYVESQEALYLQCKDKDGKTYRTVQKWGRPGDDVNHTGSAITTRGTVDPEAWALLESPGNG